MITLFDYFVLVSFRLFWVTFGFFAVFVRKSKVVKLIKLSQFHPSSVDDRL